MKKFWGVLFLSLTLSHAALATTNIPWTKEGCESVQGTWVTAHSATDSGCDAAHCNGKNFCRSNIAMNWWSALIWCKSIGRELTDLETACPNGFASSKTCANLSGTISYSSFNWYSWTTMPASQTQIYVNHFNEIRPVAPSNNYEAKALCK